MILLFGRLTVSVHIVNVMSGDFYLPATIAFPCSVIVVTILLLLFYTVHVDIVCTIIDSRGGGTGIGNAVRGAGECLSQSHDQINVCAHD